MRTRSIFLNLLYIKEKFRLGSWYCFLLLLLLLFALPRIPVRLFVVAQMHTKHTEYTQFTNANTDTLYSKLTSLAGALRDSHSTYTKQQRHACLYIIIIPFEKVTTDRGSTQTTPHKQFCGMSDGIQSYLECFSSITKERHG